MLPPFQRADWMNIILTVFMRHLVMRCNESLSHFPFFFFFFAQCTITVSPPSLFLRPKAFVTIRFRLDQNHHNLPFYLLFCLTPPPPSYLFIPITTTPFLFPRTTRSLTFKSKSAYIFSESDSGLNSPERHFLQLPVEAVFSTSSF